MGSSSNVTVPVKLFHEAEGHSVTIELRNGELYRGHLDLVEDTMNCQLSTVVRTGVDGKITKYVYNLWVTNLQELCIIWKRL
jgi:small nuclear ribonucleoprotein D3